MIYRTHQARADFYFIYVREAHAANGWQVQSNLDEGVVIGDAIEADDRNRAARLCARNLQITIPVLADTMDNAAEREYQAWPERLYILSADGSVLYQGGRGPYGFDTEELSAALEGLGA